MALALMPLMALAAWQGALRFERDRAAIQVRLEDRASIIAASRLNPIEATASILKVLATDEQVRLAVQPECATLAATISATVPQIRAIVVHDSRGVPLCVGGDPLVATVPPVVAGPESMPLAGDSGVLVARLPPAVEQPPGSLMMVLPLPGGTSVSALVAPHWIGQLDGTLDGRSRYVVSLTDADGTVLASSWPLDWKTIRMADERRGRQLDADGRSWLHGRARLFEGPQPQASLWLVLSQPEPKPFDATWLFNVSYVLLPLVALLLASLAIWIGTDRTILRWIRDIGATADTIGRGDRLPDDDRFGNAPTEVRALAAQMKRVSRIIADRDQTLRRAAAQERLSALELNHRIRNNLQIIASWVALERGQLAPGVADDALDRIELRVAAISLVHRLFYDAGQMALDGPGSLLQPLGRLLERHGVGDPILVRPSNRTMPIGIDVAVSLALWVAEAGIALLSAGRGARSLLMSERGGRLCLSLGPVDAPDGSGLGIAVPPMLQAIAQQLGGEATAEVTAGTGEHEAELIYRLTIPSDRLEISNLFFANTEQ